MLNWYLRGSWETPKEIFDIKLYKTQMVEIWNKSDLDFNLARNNFRWYSGPLILLETWFWPEIFLSSIRNTIMHISCHWPDFQHSWSRKEALEQTKSWGNSADEVTPVEEMYRWCFSLGLLFILMEKGQCWLLLHSPYLSM